MVTNLTVKFREDAGSNPAPVTSGVAGTEKLEGPGRFLSGKEPHSQLGIKALDVLRIENNPSPAGWPLKGNKRSAGVVRDTPAHGGRT